MRCGKRYSIYSYINYSHYSYYSHYSHYSHYINYSHYSHSSIAIDGGPAPSISSGDGWPTARCS